MLSTMSPCVADPNVRTALVETAARLLAEQEGLTIRRLAHEVGTSTMAVYTHFGSMEDLRRAVRLEGFARLAAHLDAVERSRDPVADLSALGWAYCFNALANPNLYRVMFLEAPIDAEEAESGGATFAPVVAAVQRCIDAGRFTSCDAWSLAVQTWTMVHGMVGVVLAGVFGPDEMLGHLSTMTVSLYVGNGDSRAAAVRSLARARRRMEPHAPIKRSDGAAEFERPRIQNAAP